MVTFICLIRNKGLSNWYHWNHLKNGSTLIRLFLRSFCNKLQKKLKAYSPFQFEILVLYFRLTQLKLSVKEYYYVKSLKNHKKRRKKTNLCICNSWQYSASLTGISSQLSGGWWQCTCRNGVEILQLKVARSLAENN